MNKINFLKIEIIISILSIFIPGCKNNPVNDIIAPYDLRWIPQPCGTKANLNAVQFFDESIGIVAGDNGTILRTTDGGNSWVHVCSGTVENLYGLHFFNSKTGYVVGSSSIVMKTTDRGLSWRMQYSDSNHVLYSVYSSEGGYTYAAGSGGFIIKSNTMDINWKQQHNIDTNDLFCVKQPLLVICSGANGTMLVSSDFDTAWTKINAGNGTNLNSIYFVNSFVGYAAGGQGIILKTSDRGMSWINEQSHSTSRISTIKFGFDTCSGFAIGENGMFLKTTDCGSNWKSVKTTTTDFLRDVYFINAKTGWATGDNGLILHTTTGGE